jgi:hypothetical protein
MARAYGPPALASGQTYFQLQEAQHIPGVSSSLLPPGVHAAISLRGMAVRRRRRARRSVGGEERYELQRPARARAPSTRWVDGGVETMPRTGQVDMAS